MQKIAPCLWFNGNAEQAVKFYVSVFKRSKITSIMRHGDAGPGKKGSVLMMEFKLEGQDFMALNGGADFPHSMAISLYVHCKDQKETDALWRKLLKGGGKEIQCGWVTDKFGVSWQIIPDQLPKLLMSKDKAKSDRAMKAMMQMVKIDIKTLERAAAGA
ncbi:MAG TPA: VOC family protein [Myxococcaceae bacterium]|nr:VOC family protein [Myxococcaceae bacterium]